MNITLTKMSEKNTKRQILMEHEKALKIIDELKASSPKKIVNENNVVVKSTKVEEIIKYFNNFSNELKEDMSIENSVIQELKDKIEGKKDAIRTIYMSSPEMAIDELIKTYDTLLQEQNDNLEHAKSTSHNELEQIKDTHNTDKDNQITFYKNKKDEFELSSIRTDKEDIYNREKSIDKLNKERVEFKIENTTQIDNLKEEYETKWAEEDKKLEEDQKLHNDTIKKAKELQESFDKEIESKISSIVGRQKSNNTYELRNIEQEYNNKIKLKNTQLANLEDEENLLNCQISDLQEELAVVQEKAHILATKTIESKSTTHSFQAMKDVAMEQAKSKK